MHLTTTEYVTLIDKLLTYYDDNQHVYTIVVSVDEDNLDLDVITDMRAVHAGFETDPRKIWDTMQALFEDSLTNIEHVSFYIRDERVVYNVAPTGIQMVFGYEHHARIAKLVESLRAQDWPQS